jgi:hypothetical protein
MSGSALYYVAQMMERLIDNGEYRVKWEWAFSSLEELARDAARVEWKFGCADDGTPKDWQEWKDLRASVEKSGVGLRGPNARGVTDAPVTPQE